LKFRIAKTGSQAFIALLYQLEKENNFKVRLEMMQTEFLMEPPEIVASTVMKTQQVIFIFCLFCIFTKTF